jgi:CubicO group peptidase (beta-lactamase class C family)
MGGISSHAGLFGSAEDVAGLAWRLALDDAGGLRSVLQRWWDRAAPGTHRGGWDKRSTGGAYTATGARFPDDTVGHLGYTGCSVWVARSRRTVAVLLSNRVHEVDDLTAIRALRPAFHDAVAADLGWPDPEPG